MSRQQKSLGIVLKNHPQAEVSAALETLRHICGQTVGTKETFPVCESLMAVADTSNAACLQLEFRWTIKL